MSEEKELPPLNSEHIGAKFFINGFPKAGMHLLECMMIPFAKEQMCRWPTDIGLVEVSWIPVFKENAWTTTYERAQLTTYALSRVTEGHYLKGHMGYLGAYVDFMRAAGIAHLFIYRDPRDVAVSIAHELWYKKGQPGLSSKFGVKHPAKEEFRAMDSFDEVLSAVINGYRHYPGVMKRWYHYQDWLDSDQPLIFRFEDTIRNPQEAAKRIIRYTAQTMSQILGLNISLEQDLLDKMAANMAKHAGETDRSPTFRSGRVGDWRECFTPRHIVEFKDSDVFNVLVQLGYAEDHNWGI